MREYAPQYQEILPLVRIYLKKPAGLSRYDDPLLHSNKFADFIKTTHTHTHHFFAVRANFFKEKNLLIRDVMSYKNTHLKIKKFAALSVIS
jgi:hypothetical protein